MGVSTNFKRSIQTHPVPETITHQDTSKKNYLSIRTGAGMNVFNDGYPFNRKLPVYTLSGEYGKIFNNKYKVGIGGFYRYYEHYFRYLRNNESLVQQGREFENLKGTPVWNASNIALFIKGELLFNHFGVELLLGANLHKPAYSIDWRINEGWDFAPRDIPEPPAWQLGTFGSKFKFKQAITARLGIKYYLRSLDLSPKTNLYTGVFLNTNLGQADVTELAVGYMLLL